MCWQINILSQFWWISKIILHTQPLHKSHTKWHILPFPACLNITLFDCALHSTSSSKQHSSSTTTNLKHSESCKSSIPRKRSEVTWKGGLLRQVLSKVLHTTAAAAQLCCTDAYIWLASFFSGGKPDKPHLRSCDFCIVPSAKQHTFTKTSHSFISILAAKPDGVWLNGPAWPAIYGEGLGFA